MIQNNVSVAEIIEESNNNVIPFSIIKNDDFVCRKKNKDEVGESCEVYAFRTQEELAAMLKVLNKHIKEATNNDQKKSACRNKLLFLIGINVGIRASDLRTLKWSFFFDRQDNGKLEYKKFYSLQPMKQRKQNKFVKLFFNQAVKTAIDDYIAQYPIEDLDDHLFLSRKGDESLTVHSLRRIIKNIASEAGIKQNIGSHSLRKTFGFWRWHEAKDKNKALVILQQAFQHSSPNVTARYIGILDDEIEDMFCSVELGLDMMDLE